MSPAHVTRMRGGTDEKIENDRLIHEGGGEESPGIGSLSPPVPASCLLQQVSQEQAQTEAFKMCLRLRHGRENFWPTAAPINQKAAPRDAIKADRPKGLHYKQQPTAS